MSVEIMTRVWKHSEATGVELLLLVALADYAGDDGYCYPRQDTLAQKIRTTDRNVRRYLARLQERGEVFILSGRGRPSDSQRWEHNRYVVAVGMGAEELAGVLSHHFEMTDSEAAEQAQKVIGRIRPDTQESNRTKRVKVIGRNASEYPDESRQSNRTNSSDKPSVKPPTDPSVEPSTTTGGLGGGGGPDDSGGVLGVSSKTEGGGQGEGIADIPAHIADQWVKLFGEMTQEQGKFLVNQLKAQGAAMVGYALGIAADNMTAGTEVRKPALYVKTIIAKRIADGDFGPAAHRRPGEVDNEAQRRKYLA